MTETTEAQAPTAADYQSTIRRLERELRQAKRNTEATADAHEEIVEQIVARERCQHEEVVRGLRERIVTLQDAASPLYVALDEASVPANPAVVARIGLLAADRDAGWREAEQLRERIDRMRYAAGSIPVHISEALNALDGRLPMDLYDEGSADSAKQIRAAAEYISRLEGERDKMAADLAAERTARGEESLALRQSLDRQTRRAEWLASEVSRVRDFYTKDTKKDALWLWGCVSATLIGAPGWDEMGVDPRVLKATADARALRRVFNAALALTEVDTNMIGETLSDERSSTCVLAERIEHALRNIPSAMIREAGAALVNLREFLFEPEEYASTTPMSVVGRAKSRIADADMLRRRLAEAQDSAKSHREAHSALIESLRNAVGREVPLEDLVSTAAAHKASSEVFQARCTALSASHFRFIEDVRRALQHDLSTAMATSRIAKEVEKLKREHTEMSSERPMLRRYEAAAKALWAILDNIDTSSDALKPSDIDGYKAFYEATMRRIAERHSILTTDGEALRLPRPSVLAEVDAMRKFADSAEALGRAAARHVGMDLASGPDKTVVSTVIMDNKLDVRCVDPDRMMIGLVNRIKSAVEREVAKDGPAEVNVKVVAEAPGTCKAADDLAGFNAQSETIDFTVDDKPAPATTSEERLDRALAQLASTIAPLEDEICDTELKVEAAEARVLLRRIAKVLAGALDKAQKTARREALAEVVAALGYEADVRVDGMSPFPVISKAMDALRRALPGIEPSMPLDYFAEAASGCIRDEPEAIDAEFAEVPDRTPPVVINGGTNVINIHVGPWIGEK